jgi:hypothetical protein
MSSRRIEQVIDASIAPAFPGFVRRKRLLFDRNVEWLLRGFYFDASAFNKSSLVNVFVQPLYIPSSTIRMTLGKRLGRWHWQTEGAETILEAMRDAGTRFLGALPTPASLHDPGTSAWAM